MAGPPPQIGACASSKTDLQGDCIRQIEVDHGHGLTEWWRAQSTGLEQGWTLASAPEGQGLLVVTLALEGATATVDASGVDATLYVGQQTVPYTGLRAKDADGRVLEARLEADDHVLRVLVDDTSARYPVTIDPYVLVYTGAIDAMTEPHVEGLGDVNGDGYADFFFREGLGKVSSDLTIYVFMSGPSGLQSPQALTQTQKTAAGVGDINQDGYDDFIVSGYDSGAPANQRARLYVYYGSPDGLPSEPNDVVFVAGGNSTFASAISGGGDINGDGYPDVVVGDPGYASSGSFGRVQVLTGGASGLSHTVLRTFNETENYYLGYSVANLGDVNGDGFADFAAGAPYYPSVSLKDGLVRVYLGNATGGVESKSYYGSNRREVGVSVAAAGDVNGDGLADLIVGAPSQAGINYPGISVYLGSSVTSNHGLETTPIFISSGNGIQPDRFGTMVSGIGDVNGDGLADVGAGTYAHMKDLYGFTGFSAMFFHGKPDGVNSPGIGWVHPDIGPLQKSYFPVGLWGLGDVDGDGLQEYGVGTPAVSGSQGEIYIYSASCDPVDVTGPAQNTCLDPGVTTITWDLPDPAYATTDYRIWLSYTTDRGGHWKPLAGPLAATETSFTLPVGFEPDEGLRVRVAYRAEAGQRLVAMGLASGLVGQHGVQAPVLEGEGATQAATCQPRLVWNYPVHHGGVTFDVRNSANQTLASGLEGRWWDVDVVLPAGLNDLRVVAVDCDGHEEASGVAHYQVSHDPVAPVIDTSIQWVSGLPFTLEWSAPDQVPGAVYRVFIDGVDRSGPLTGLSFTVPTTVPFARGMHTWYVVAEACDDGQAASATGEIGTDTSAPRDAAFLTPPDHAYTHPLPVFTWTEATDTQSGVCGYELTLDGTPIDVGLTLTYTPSAPLAAGSHTASLVAYDCLGHRSTPVNHPYLVDADLPSSPEFILPEPANWLDTATPLVRWTIANDATSGVCGYELSVDDTVVYADTSTSVTLPTPLPDATGIELSVVALDCAGNRSAAEHMQVNHDGTAPEAPVLSSPEAGKWYGQGNHTFTWNAVTDALSGVCAYNLVVDNNLVFTDPSATSTSWGSGLAHGAHTAVVQAVDCAGNVASSDPVTFQIDRSYPTEPSFLQPLDGSWGGPLPTFVWKESLDTGSGVCSYQLREQGGNVLYTGADTSFTATAPISEGMHTFLVLATDCTLNSSLPGYVTYGVDLTPPAAPVFTAPTGGAWRTTSFVDFAWTEPADNASGVCGYELWIDDFLVYDDYDHQLSTYALSDGSHTAVVKAYDCAGNLSDPSSPITINVDTQDPSAPVFTSPQPLSWTDTLPTLTWSAATEADSGVCEYALSINGSPDISVRDWETSYTFTTPLNHGPQSVMLTAYDCAGLKSDPAILSFNVDAIAPYPPSFQYPFDDEILSGEPVSFGWVATSDSGSGLSGYELGVDGVLRLQTGENTTSGLLDAGLAHGPHQASLVAIDMVGNRSEPVLLNFFVDTLPPTTPVFTAPTPGVWSAPTVSLTWLPSTDEDSALCGYELYDGAVRVSSGTDTSYTPSPPLSDGIHSFTLFAVDCVDNHSDTASLEVKVDTTSPTPPAFTYPIPGESVKSATIGFAWSAATDATSGVCGYSLTLDSGSTVYTADGDATGLSATVSGSGSYTAALWARDCAGNSSVSTSVSFTVDLTVPDTTPPSTPVITDPVDGTWTPVAAPWVSWQASTDAESGVCMYELTIDGAPAVTTSDTHYAYPNVADGLHTASLVAIDCEGNRSSPTTVNFGTDITKPSQPSYVTPSFANHWFASTTTFAWTPATDASSGICGYSLRETTGAGALLYEGPDTSWTPSEPLAEGEYTFALLAYDCAGNASTLLTTYGGVDETPPEAPVFTTPASGAIYDSSLVDFDWSESLDAVAGVCGYELWIDGSPHYDGPGESNLVFALADGEHTALLTAYDCAGNTSSASSVTFEIDTGAPSEPVFTSPAQDAWLSTGSPTFTWAASTDLGSGVCRYTLTLAGSTYSVSGTSFTPPVSLAQGAYTALLTAVDCAGNLSGSAELSFGIDLDAPQTPVFTTPSGPACQHG